LERQWANLKTQELSFINDLLKKARLPEITM
jgi:hypothetical protein